MCVVVSDASPLRYLILLRQAQVLHGLYGKVLVPQAVVDELQRKQTPEPVRRWMSTPPSWLEVVQTIGKAYEEQGLDILGSGERQAIAVAQHAGADLLLMDDREGVEEARRRGLTVIGTLGVLDLAAECGLIDLTEVLSQLRETNFRARPSLFKEMLRRDAKRKAGEPPTPE